MNSEPSDPLTDIADNAIIESQRNEDDEGNAMTALDAARDRTALKLEAREAFGDKNTPADEKPCWTIIPGEWGWKHFLERGVLTRVTPCGRSAEKQLGGRWKRAACPECEAYVLANRHRWLGVRR